MHTKSIVQHILKADTSEVESHLSLAFQGIHRSWTHWYYNGKILYRCSWIRISYRKKQRSWFNKYLLIKCNAYWSGFSCEPAYCRNTELVLSIIRLLVFQLLHKIMSLGKTSSINNMYENNNFWDRKRNRLTSLVFAWNITGFHVL